MTLAELLDQLEAQAAGESLEYLALLKRPNVLALVKAVRVLLAESDITGRRLQLASANKIIEDATK